MAAPSNSGAQEDDSSREAPIERIASVGGTINDWVEHGHYLYVGQGDSLRVYDQTDRAHPKPVAWIPLRYGSRKLAMVGDRLWIHEVSYNSPRYENGNYCYDISEPARPREIKDAEETDEVEAKLNDDSPKRSKPNLSLPFTSALSVVAGDARVLVQNEKKEWLMLDTADPENPVLLGKTRLLDDDRPVAFENHFIYAIGSKPGLRVYDAARPGKCVLRSKVELKAPVEFFSIEGTRAYAALGKEGLAILDISNPAQPRVMGAHTTAVPCRSVIAKGNVVVIHANDLFVLDAADPEHIKASSKLWVSDMLTTDTAPAVNPLAPESSLSDWTFDGRSIVLLWGEGEFSTFLQWIDCRNPSDPIPVKTGEGEHYDRYDSVSSNGAFVIAKSFRHNTGESTTFLKFFEQGAPDKPRYLGEWAHFCEITDYAARGDLIYVADGENGLVILRMKGAK